MHDPDLGGGFLGGQHVLVTGATGFTGGHLARRLAGEGHVVRALVRDPERARALRDAGVQLVEGDLKDRASLERAVEDIQTVYHIAALFRPENVFRQDMWDVNVEGTRSLLEAAIEARVGRFVHCSTVGVHGHIEEPPADEDAPFAPGDYYQESKTEGERVAREYMENGRIPVVIFRPGGIYGPGDLRFLKLFRAIKKRTFVMLGSGLVPYQMIYIDDLVDGIIKCGTLPQAVGQTYILTGEAPLTVKHLVEMVADQVGTSPPRLRIPVWPVYAAGFLCELIFKPLGINPPLYRRRVDFFRKARSFRITKAQRELDFHPVTDLRTGLTRTHRWYLANGYL